MVHFEAFAKERSFEEHAEVLKTRVPHTERTRRAVVHGGGLGVVKYNGPWAVAVGGPPSDRGLNLRGVPMPEGAFSGRWSRWASSGCGSGRRSGAIAWRASSVPWAASLLASE